MNEVIYEVKDGIATVTINRPEKLNALTTQTYSELHDAIARFITDTSAVVLVLTGAGRAFCSGQDLNEVQEISTRSPAEIQQGLDTVQNITRMLINMNKPSVAAINGPAVGAGAEIPLACDLRFAAEGSFFFFPELKHGLFTTNASTCLLPRLIGHSRASELLFLGEQISGETALGFGLINRLVSTEEFEKSVLAAARRLRDNHPQATALLKQALRTNPQAGVEKSLKAEIAATMDLAVTASDRD